MPKKKPNILAAKREEGISHIASMYAKLNFGRSEIEAALLAQAKNCEGPEATIAPWVADRIFSLLTTFRDFLKILGISLKYSILPPRQGKYQNEARDRRAEVLRENGKSYGEIAHVLFSENPEWGDDEKPLSNGAVYRLLQRSNARKEKKQKKGRQAGNEPGLCNLPPSLTNPFPTFRFCHRSGQ